VDYIGRLSVSLGLGTADDALVVKSAVTALTLRSFKGRKRLRRQLSCELVEQELAACLLQILLTHGSSAFETGIDEGRWA